MNNEHFPGLSPNPAEITSAISQDNGGVDFMGAESEVYEYIFALGIKLIDIAPAIRAKLSDGPPSYQSEWFLLKRSDAELPAPQIYQHRSFQILDCSLWLQMKEGRVMNKQLC